VLECIIDCCVNTLGMFIQRYMCSVTDYFALLAPLTRTGLLFDSWVVGEGIDMVVDY
jgi:hypothetical protein